MLPLRATGAVVGITGMTTIVLPLGVTMAATIADIIMAGTATMVVTITEAIATAEVGRAPGGRRALLGRTQTASP